MNVPSMELLPRSKALLTIFRALLEEYGQQRCALNYRNAYELLVATVLSAQCTDARVNIITQSVFKKYPAAAALAQAEQAKVEHLIASAGLFRSKAKNLIAAAGIIVKDFNGTVPDNMSDLVTLPGVGRKTANVLLGNIFNVPGFAVDTHVKRVLRRLGMTLSDSPVEIEAEINAAMPKQYWTDFSHLLIAHGRRVCRARKPDCQNCVLTKICVTSKQ
jgi:endonuclease-3